MATSTIDDIVVKHYRVPLPEVQTNSLHSATHFEYIIVTVAGSGWEGTGFAYTTGYGGAAVKTLIEKQLVPLLRGAPAASPSKLWDSSRRHLSRGGYGYHASLALAAVDIALWDGLAKRQELPLYELLGGWLRDIPTYGSLVTYSETPERLAERLEGLKKSGYEAFKIRMGADRGQDLACLAAARDVLGATAPLFVDANKAWTQFDAMGRRAALETADVGFVEEPLPLEDVAGYRRLARTLGFPLAGGEEINSSTGFASFFVDQILSVAQPDVVRLGGVTEWLRVSSAARAHGIPVMTHYTIEVAAHLAAADSNVRYVEITDHNMCHLGVSTGGIVEHAGFARPTETPGHGILYTFSDDQLVG